MRIQTLTLKNFRSHRETQLELDRFNFIRGPNGCGKSSIQMALEYLFTGRCELTDAAGRGGEGLIRSGEKELEVSATLESGETICRRRTPKSQVIEIKGKRVPVDAAETFLAKQFGSADVLSALLNAGRFVEMSKVEQKKLLAQMVDAGRVDIPQQICEALRTLNEEPPKLASISDVETAYRRFYELRTDASRALTAMGGMEKPDVPSDLPSVQEAKRKLEDLRQRKERLVAEADACWQIAQKQLKHVQAETEEVSSEILRPSQQQELLQLESKWGHAEQRQELADLIEEQRAVEKALATAQGLQDKCPTCQQPISEATKAKEAKTRRERLAELGGLIRRTREELNEYRDIEAGTSRLENHRKALPRCAKLAEEQSKVKEVHRHDPGDVEGRMAIVIERINEGERVLEKAQQAHSIKEKWEACVREKSALETKLNVLDTVTEFFGPNGAIMAQASGRIGSLNERLNQDLTGFGYTCNFALDPFEIRVATANNIHSGLSLKQLSESERFRFSIAFQIALATVTGIRFVVVDRADVLDKSKRKLLTSMLVNGDLNQSIVLATSEEPPPMAIPQGVKFVDLTRLAD